MHNHRSLANKDKELTSSAKMELSSTPGPCNTFGVGGSHCLDYNTLLGSPFTNDFQRPQHYSESPDSSGDPLDPSRLTTFIDPGESEVCDESPLNTTVLSLNPPVIYITSFLKEAEIKHLIQSRLAGKDSNPDHPFLTICSEPNYMTSHTYKEGQSAIDQTSRKSENAELVRDHTVKCIEKRAQHFQRWKPTLALEPLSVQRYSVNGFFSHHFDSTALDAPDRSLHSMCIFRGTVLAVVRTFHYSSLHGRGNGVRL